MNQSIAFILMLALCISGCSKIPLEQNNVSCIVYDRINIDPEPTCCVQYVLSELLEQEVTPDSAIQIALLNNPKILALYEEINVSQADLIEAGLLTNPSFELESRFPCVKSQYTNVEYLIVGSVLDLFLIPLRTRLAQAVYEQTKLRIANEMLDLAFDVRETYYSLFFEMKNVGYLESLTELSDINAEIISRQLEVGNVNQLGIQFAQSNLLKSQLELAHSRSTVISLKERLHRLLGFSNEICFKFPDSIFLESYEGYDLCELESAALTYRLDLQIASLEIVRINQKLGLNDPWVYTHLSAGLAGERDPDGTNVVGVGFTGRLPIFNYGQAARKRLYAERRAAQARLNELNIKAITEIREAHQLLMNYSEIIVDYNTRFIPLQNEILTTSEAYYNIMGLGIDKLLLAKKNEIEAEKNFSEAKKSYLISKVKLDRALGGYLELVLQQKCNVNGAAE